MSGTSASPLSPNQFTVTDQLTYTDLEKHYKDVQGTKYGSQQIRGRTSGANGKDSSRTGDQGKIDVIYNHKKWKLSRPGCAAATDRAEKYRNGAQAVKNALTKEFGAEFVAKLTTSLNSRSLKFWKRIDLNKQVKVKDLPTIRKAIVAQQKAQKLALANARNEIDDAINATKSFLPNPEMRCEQELTSITEFRKDAEKLRTHLDNENYCRSNFEGIELNNDETPTFTAKFKGCEDLVFSNRTENLDHGELRGERMRGLLESANYRTLRELIDGTFNTKDDSTLRFIADSVKNVVSRQIQMIWKHHPGFSNDDARALWDDYKSTSIGGVSLQTLCTLDIDALRTQHEEGEKTTEHW